MTTLVPTVHERLARCNTRVYVDGLVAGADVELDVDGALFNQSASGGGLSFVVPSLAAGATVRARQDAGAGFTPWSPPVVVEEVALPPPAAPRLPESVGLCSHCVWLTGLVPGCDVELSIGGTIVGTGTASLNGDGCFGVDLTGGQDPGVLLTARMIVCGQPGPLAGTPLAAEPAAPPKPVVGSPLFGCQRVVPLSNLHPGSRVRLETDAGTDLGSFCTCWGAANVWIGPSLVPGERVRAQAYWDGRRQCKAGGPWSDWQLVVPPDERIKPVVEEALIEGDQIIRVSNQIPGGELTIRIRPDETQPYEEFGPRPASDQPEIALNAPLVAGNVVTVVQTLCGHKEESEPVTVLPRPPVVHAPVIVPPLYECGAAVQVSSLYPGALVRLYQDGIPIGLGWAGLNVSLPVTANPSLVAGAKVTAKQWVGGVESPESDGVEVLPLPEEIPGPVILGPVAYGDRGVWVSGVLPGAQVAIYEGSNKIGERYAAEPIVLVPVSPVSDVILVKTMICDRSRSGGRIMPIPDPCARGGFTNVGEQKLDFGLWPVPDTDDGGPFDMPLFGQLYFPSDGGNEFAEGADDLPLVVIAHGYWSDLSGGGFNTQSHLGYDYLAHHLASWGMVVFSVNMDEVNARSSTPTELHQYSRGEIILHLIDELLADPFLKNRIDPNRIGLVGHSMGGEGVVVAQLLNESQGRGYGIRGVCSIAPTNWRPEVGLRQANYMQLLGSQDLLVRAGVDPVFSGFRLYDRAWRPKSHFWIYGARHNPFNRWWVANGDNFEEGLAGLALPAADHERLARCLINAFFQDALVGWSEYGGYMEGVVLPQGVRDLEIYTQYSSEVNRRVLDNYGDADDQEGVAAEALNKSDNVQNQVVNAGGAGLGVWQDVDLTTVGHAPHETLGVELSWSEPNVFYVSETGGLGLTTDDWVMLRAGQFYEDAALNLVNEPIDFFVVLSDGANEAVLRAGSVALVPYPDATPGSLAVMRTIRLPLNAFTVANPVLNMGNIQSVSLRLMGRFTGHILADDLEFSR